MKTFNVSKTWPLGRASVVAAMAAISLSALSTAATAGEPDVLHVTVRYHDLDVRKPAEAQALLQRIKYAAERVCGDEHIVDLGQWADIRRCRAEAVGRAVREADIPTLTALVDQPAAPLTMARR